MMSQQLLCSIHCSNNIITNMSFHVMLQCLSSSSSLLLPPTLHTDSPHYSKILHHTPFPSHSQSTGTCIDTPPPLPFPPSSISVFPSQSNDHSTFPVTLSVIR